MDKIRTLIFIGSCALVVTQCSGNSGSWKPQDMEPIKVEQTFRITGVNICSPEGHFILIRQNRDLAGLKFFNARKGSQTGTGIVQYIAYLPTGNSGDFQGSLEKRKGTASVKGWSGFHPFVIEHGDYKLKIGPFRLTYDFPTCLWLEDASTEYAPTPWTRIEDIDASAAGLRWFKYDATGELSLEILPEDLHIATPQPK
jgi:hypothetical protein